MYVLYHLAGIVEKSVRFICVMLLFFCVIPQLWGMEIGVVKSGSMEPALKTGSIIYIKKQSAETIQEGDIIVFSASGITVSHRVQSVSRNTETFLTKGDNNLTADIAPVTFQSVSGKVIAAIPYMGYVYVWIRSHVFQISICLLIVQLFKRTLWKKNKVN